MDTLYLVKPGFGDPAFPGRIFYCWHCALIEGILVSCSHLTNSLAVERIKWPKPRTPIVTILGEQNQTVPLMVLPKGSNSKYQTGIYRDRAFIADKDAILAALTERHGFPEPHP